MTNWQTPEDVAQRRIILLNIIFQLTSRYGMDPTIAPRIARHAELALYAWANSRQEYQNPRTLIKRLQALVIKCYAQQSSSWKSQYSSLSSSQSNIDDAQELVPQLEENERSSKKYKISTEYSSIQYNDILLLGGHEELSKMIFSYIDTKELLRNRCISKHANNWLPKLVKLLHLPIAHLRQLNLIETKQLLSLFPNLESIWLFTETSLQENKSIPSNLEQCANETISSLISFLTYFPKLRELHIRSAYCDDFMDRITKSLVDILLLQACPELQVLDLRGNCISDYGAQHISRLISSEACKKLSNIDLQYNFIGERGSILLYKVIGDNALCKVNVLRLRNNLLRGICLKKIARSLGKQSSVVEPLHFTQTSLNQESMNTVVSDLEVHL